MGGLLSSPLTCKVQEKYGNKHVKVATCSMQGSRCNMEDSHCVRLELGDKHADTMFFGVYDGHYGPDAAHYCHSAIADACTKLKSFTQATLETMLLEVDAEFLREDNPNREHGCTAVFAFVKPSRDGYGVTVANVGDSRCVWGSIDAPVPGYYKVTEDHCPTNEVERERIIAAGGFVDQKRVDGNLALSRAIGDWNFKGNEKLPPAEQKVCVIPDVTDYLTKKGDWLLLACDGIFERMSTDKVAEYISQQLKQHSRDPFLVTRELCDQALRTGSCDNMTAVLVVFDDGTDYTDTPGKGIWIEPSTEIHPDADDVLKAYRDFAIDQGFSTLLEKSSSPGNKNTRDVKRPRNKSK